jgi:probable phosphoglycerate mutase
MQVVLIRHAHSEANAKGVLSGRLPDVHLSAKGIAQSEALVTRLGALKIAAIKISPLERCAETINPWWVATGKPNNRGVEVEVDPNLIEVDYGSWSGKKLSQLSRNSMWKTVQNNPSAMYFPSGESLAVMQTRAMKSVHDALRVRRKGSIVLVSHGDVIKSIVASALGMHLDDFQRIVIDPASVTILDFSQSKPRLTLMNDSSSNLENRINAPYRKGPLLGGGAGI